MKNFKELLNEADNRIFTIVDHKNKTFVTEDGNFLLKKSKKKLMGIYSMVEGSGTKSITFGDINIDDLIKMKYKELKSFMIRVEPYKG